MSNKRKAVITGASSGIGAAIAERLAAEGWELFLGARRIDKLNAVANKIGAHAIALDVANQVSVSDFCQKLPEKIDLLVNNAGGAIGLEPVAEANDQDWLDMYQSNVLGLMRMTRGVLPKLLSAGGQIINVTSITGRKVYANGAGYAAAKFAARAVTETLNLELNGTPIRVTDLAPGAVETEFSDIRFKGDSDKAAAVYQGYTPLTAKDIADCVSFIVSLPKHVNISELVVKPTAQADTRLVARGVGL
jgi:NADP-dependent 3-hydroxy acid dehydrogenase YdfG